MLLRANKTLPRLTLYGMRPPVPGLLSCWLTLCL